MEKKKLCLPMQPEVQKELAQRQNRKRLFFSDFSMLQAVAKIGAGDYNVIGTHRNTPWLLWWWLLVLVLALLAR